MIGPKRRRGTGLSPSAIVEELSTLQRKALEPKGSPSWIGPQGKLSIRLRVRALLLCWKSVGDITPEALGKKIDQRWIGVRPERRSSPRPTADSYWDAGTFATYLTANPSRLSTEHASQVFEHVIALMAEASMFAVRFDIPAVKARLNVNDVSVRDFVREVFYCMGRLGQPSVLPPSGFKSVIGPSFTGGQRPALEALRPIARQALDHLQQSAGRRVVLLRGEPHTGKKFVIQILLSAGSRGEHLRLDDGQELPILALSLQDHTPNHFIDLVFDYYENADAELRLGTRRSFLLSPDGRLEAIREMATRIPGCIMLADTEPVEEDEVVRRLHDGHVRDVLLSLQNAHPTTRLVLTVTNEIRLPDLPHSEVKLLDVPSKLGIERIWELPPSLQKMLPPNVIATGLSWALALSTDLMARKRNLSADFMDRVGRITAQHLGDPAKLVGFLFDQILGEREQLIVGLIASSHDGLRRSVLDRLLLLFDAAFPNQCPPGPEVVLPALEPIVARREALVEQGLVFHGESEREPLFCVDAAWRRMFLERWWMSRPTQARFVMWLIAREAARQARRLRIFESGTQQRSVEGRDVQAIYGLLASVDHNGAFPGEAGCQAGGEQFLERKVLPTPAELRAPMPDPRTALRFAFFQLYRADLESNAHRLLTVFEDAKVRLGILLTFFTPNRPWELLKDRELLAEWGAYEHLSRVFTPRELLSLLTNLATAAQRVRLDNIVSVAVKLGEKLVERYGIAEVSKTEFMRLLRAEVELGLLLGGNPDELRGASITFYGMNLGAVEQRLERILEKYFPQACDELLDREHMLARGKLLARLGELRHVMGSLRTARDAFDEAQEIEKQMLAIRPLGTAIAPVFGGRGSRAVLRFQLDVGRRIQRPKFPGHFESWFFNFVDELRLPESQRLSSDATAVRWAATLIDENARRLNRGRPVDSLGIKIDAARLALTQHEFAHALLLLDAAANARSGSDPSIETQLELAAIHTRFTIEAAMLCLRGSRPEAVFTSHQELNKLRAYLGCEAETPALDLAGMLSERTGGLLKRFDTVAGHVPGVHPYATYALYMRGIWNGLQSRLVDADGRVKFLEASRGHLEMAVAQMQQADYRMHLREARIILRAVKKALVTPPGGPSQA